MDYKAGMFIYALAFLLGVIAVQQMASLPELPIFLLSLALVCLCFIAHSLLRRQKQSVLTSQTTLIYSFILLINIGIIYASCYADQQLLQRFDGALIGQNILIQGKVAGIPVSSDKVRRFEFKVESFRLLTAANSSIATEFPKKIRLSWYYGRAINAGETWQLEVRLKPPHGFMNPGGFDYEAWLFQHGIHATGYVRKSRLNKRVHAASSSINVVRQSLAQQIDEIASQSDEHGRKSFALLKALAIGDKSSISSEQWRVLANTGTSHLMAISGLHIGLASLFAYVLIRRLVPVPVIKHIPAQHVALSGGMITALLYALIAGLSIPTQRAIIMLFVLSVMMIVRRNHRPVDALGFALIAVLLIDPVAPLAAGFWFSFSAVAVIFISINTSTAAVTDSQGIDSQGNESQRTENTSFWQKAIPILKQWIRLQLLISLFLLPLSLFMFQQVSLISPVANLLLIPYVSFLVVPVVLLAIIFSFLSPYLSTWLFTVAASLLDFIWPLLSYFSSLPYGLWVKGDVAVMDLMAATLALLLLFFSRQISVLLFRSLRKSVQPYACWSFRLLLCLLFIPLLIPATPVLNTAEYQLTVLDVGQGSAAVIRTKNHVVVFDTGARFSDKLDAGSGVIVPYLRSQGIKSLDRLIISHGDADHIGGAQAVIDAYPQVLVIGQDIEDLEANNKQLCFAGTKWRWDGVDFAFLSPLKAAASIAKNAKRNNHSCVLKVASAAGSVLFTGDIEKQAEKRLLKDDTSQLASDILIVPHHGSNTSSSSAFIAAVDPALSIISVGYKNRYRLPNRRVLQRYEAMKLERVQTDISGALTVKLLADSDFMVEKYREKAGKYWHHIVKP